MLIIGLCAYCFKPIIAGEEQKVEATQRDWHKQCVGNAGENEIINLWEKINTKKDEEPFY